MHKINTTLPSNRAGWNVRLINSQLQSSGSFGCLPRYIPILSGIVPCANVSQSFFASSPSLFLENTVFGHKILHTAVFSQNISPFTLRLNVLSLETSLQTIKMSVSFRTKSCSLCYPCLLLPTFSANNFALLKIGLENRMERRKFTASHLGVDLCICFRIHVNK